MAIADAALRAAREVNADAIENSSIPEVYRAAADALFKAKKEYKLKNFDKARRYAVRSTLLAERAEFEAIKAGGATPEATAARSNYQMEGAAPDPNLGADQSIDPGPGEAGQPPVAPLPVGALPPPGLQPPPQKQNQASGGPVPPQQTPPAEEPPEETSVPQQGAAPTPQIPGQAQTPTPATAPQTAAPKEPDSG